ncbi:hypothetical protein AArcMg_2150 [Natrarchaeobaculum sulfurireducens]|uniref:Uncharacterized protein n=1 Tax=Natrarchaeobaculum sulfurireducens TaxID=2044521 RepID=A0A346PRK3_9EURY|nr:hypothetical protein AArcMg_2150 [Natrarchaeobaculum sulfurireducens]
MGPRRQRLSLAFHGRFTVCKPAGGAKPGAGTWVVDVEDGWTGDVELLKGRCTHDHLVKHGSQSF